MNGKRILFNKLTTSIILIYTGAIMRKLVPLSPAILSLILSGAPASKILDRFLNEKEGNHLTSYYDNSNVWTICRGVTMVDGMPVRKGMELSSSECQKINAIERDKALAWVEHNIHVPLTAPQKAGIASFCPYNIGPRKCLQSTFYKRMNNRDTRGACEAIRWWVKDGGHDCHTRSNHCYGQILRRDQESTLTCWGIDEH